MPDLSGLVKAANDSAPIIVAFVSLVSVIVTLSLNSSAQRRSEQRRFDHEKTIERRKREEKIKVLRAVLGAEIRNIGRVFSDEVLYIEDLQNNFTWVPVGNFFQNFQEKSMDLGFLSKDELNSVMQCYYVFQENVGYLSKLGDFKPEPVRVIGCKIDTEDRRGWVLGAVKAIAESAGVAHRTLQQ